MNQNFLGAARRGVVRAAQSFCASVLERWIAGVLLIYGRLSRRVGPPIENLLGAPCRWRVLIVARHDAATRALQDTICGRQRGARLNLNRP